MRRSATLAVVAMLACGVDPAAIDPPLPEGPPALAVEASPPAAEPVGDGSASEVADGSPSEIDAQPEPPASAEDEHAPDPDGWIHGRVQSGDSLARILGRRGVSARDIAAIVTALEPIMDPATIRVGQRWSLRMADTGWTELRWQPTDVRTIHVVRDESGTLAAEIVDAETEVRTAEVVATIDSSLWNAVTGAGEDPALVAELVELFASQIDFYTDQRRGDRIAAIVEKHYIGDELVRYGRVRAATYDGAVGRISGVWWSAPGRADGAYYTPEGESLDRTLLKSPLKFTRVSSGFDPKRMHPVLHRVKAHLGIDYAAPVGTPVWAAADGTIRTRGEAGAAGNMIVLDHDGGFQTVYMHLDKFAKGHAIGDRVRQKTVIGYVGTTGRSTGPHLHFGVKRGGRWVDPATVRSIERPGVAKAQRDRFVRETASDRERLAALLEPER